MPKAIALEGILVPVLTPFDPASSDLDEAALRRLVDVLVAQRVHGLVVNANTGEFFLMDDNERKRAAEIVVEQAANRVPVLVGAGSPGTRISIDHAKHAESIGAAGLWIMPPYFTPLSVDKILRHYVDISNNVSIPIMLNNNQFISGVLLSPDDIVRFIDEANIPWIMLTTYRVDQVAGIQNRLGKRVTLFEGVDSLAFPSMANGAAGWVSGPANAIPELALSLWDVVCRDGDLAAGRELQHRLMPFLDFLWSQGAYQSILKEICRFRGYPLGAVRAPWTELTDAQRAEVHRLVSDLFGGAAPVLGNAV